MSNASLTQSFDHFLDYKKGYPSPHALDFVAPMAASATAIAHSGRVVTVDPSTNKFVLGQIKQAMPMFLRPNEGDYDVDPFPGGIAGRRFGQTGMNMGALVAEGNFELQSTEFVAGTYAVNDPLSSDTEADLSSPDLDDAGKLRLAAGYYQDDVCGVVSKGVVTNEHGKSVLQFWTKFVPLNPLNYEYY